MSKQEFLTTAQVAEHYGVTTRTVLNWIDNGRFPNAQKLPGETMTYIIPRSDIEAYDKKRRQSEPTD